MIHDGTEADRKILLSSWQQRDDTPWALCSMKGIPLLPSSAESDETFYKVDNDLIALGHNFAGTIYSTLGRSIVPIVARVDGDNELHCLGTGFFISCSGLLLTAAHIFNEPISRNHKLGIVSDELISFGNITFGVMVRLNPIFEHDGFIFKEIEWAGLFSDVSESPFPMQDPEIKLNADTAICKVKPLPSEIPFQPLAILPKGIAGIGMNVGKRVTSIGYGSLSNLGMTDHEESIEITADNFSFHCSTGEVLERFPDNGVSRTVSAPGPCFSASLKLPGGMSGSPIFDDEGVYAYGVVSKGLQSEHGLEAFGYGSLIEPSLHIPIKPLGGASVYELMDEGKHGIPNLRMAGA